MIKKEYIVNNMFLEKEIFNLIDIFLKNINDKGKLILEIQKYLELRKYITIGEYYLLKEIGIKISGEFIFQNNIYQSFFNEIEYFNKYKHIFKNIKEDFNKNIKEFSKIYKNDIKYIIYFYILFKTKKEVFNYNGVILNRKLNNVIHKMEIDDDLIFIYLSNLINVHKNTININFFYKNTVINNKIKNYLNSLLIGNKKINLNIIDMSAGEESIFVNNLDQFNNTYSITILNENIFNKYKNIFIKIDNNFLVKLN